MRKLRQVIIRNARPDEHAAVGELRVTAYRALGLLPEGSNYTQTLREFGLGATAAEYAVLVAATDNGILGTITLEPYNPDSELAQDATEADIRAFGVDPRAQGQGVGRKLLLAVIENGRQRGLQKLRLCTQSAMQTAQHLYETTGFARTPDFDFEPIPGLTLQAYELALADSTRVLPKRAPAPKPQATPRVETISITDRLGRAEGKRRRWRRH